MYPPFPPQLLHSGRRRHSAAYKQPFEDDPRSFNAFAEPLPLVVEVWWPSTGHYHVATKLQGYRGCGDAEVWFIHPYERTLIAWRRQPDETYAEETYRGGFVAVASLPGVVIDFDALLDGSADGSQSPLRVALNRLASSLGDRLIAAL